LRFSKVRAQLEVAVASCAGILGIPAIFWNDWIEALTGWGPDHRDGRVKRMVVARLPTSARHRYQTQIRPCYEYFVDVFNWQRQHRRQRQGTRPGAGLASVAAAILLFASTAVAT
jgi:hypothetical protein